MLDGEGEGGSGVVAEVIPPATNEHDAAIAEAAAEAEVEVAEIAAGAATEQTAIVAEAQADAVERGIMEIVTTHGEQISDLRNEFRAKAAADNEFQAAVLKLLAVEEEEEGEHGEHVEERHVPPEGGEQGTGEGHEGEGDGTGTGEAEPPVERRAGRRYSKHF